MYEHLRQRPEITATTIQSTAEAKNTGGRRRANHGIRIMSVIGNMRQ